MDYTEVCGMRWAVDYNEVLGKLLKKEREKRGMKRSELAKMIGYKNISKGCNNICDMEEGVNINLDVMDILGFTEEDFDRTLEEQKAQYDEIVKNLPPYEKEILRWHRAPVSIHIEFPKELEGDDLLEWACEYARENEQALLLYMDYGLRYQIKSDGSYEKYDGYRLSEIWDAQKKAFSKTARNAHIF